MGLAYPGPKETNKVEVNKSIVGMGACLFSFRQCETGSLEAPYSSSH